MQYTIEQAERNISELRAKLAQAEQRVAAAQKAMIHLRASTHGYRPDACDGCGDLDAALTPPPSTQ